MTVRPWLTSGSHALELFEDGGSLYDSGSSCRADVQSESVRHDQVPTKIEQFTSNKNFGDEGAGEVGVRPGKTKADLKELAFFFSEKPDMEYQALYPAKRLRRRKKVCR